MCLSKHIAGYEITLVSLKSAIETDDTERVHILDGAIASEFEKILDYVPKNDGEAQSMFEFLLTQLVPEGERSGFQDVIVERLASLFEQAGKPLDLNPSLESS